MKRPTARLVIVGDPERLRQLYREALRSLSREGSGGHSAPPKSWKVER